MKMINIEFYSKGSLDSDTRLVDSGPFGIYFLPIDNLEVAE